MNTVRPAVANCELRKEGLRREGLRKNSGQASSLELRKATLQPPFEICNVYAIGGIFSPSTAHGSFRPVSTAAASIMGENVLGVRIRTHLWGLNIGWHWFVRGVTHGHKRIV